MQRPFTRRRLAAALLVGSLGLAGGCRDFLDVNTNPNAPQSVSANLYLAPMLHWMVTAPQFDGLIVGRYTQEWMVPITGTLPGTYERMGYIAGSDAGGQQWRDVYWTFGQNLNDMNNKAEAEQRWDLLGVGQILKAWGWQAVTGLHGEVVITEAFDQTRFSFNYDSQEFAYQEAKDDGHEGDQGVGVFKEIRDADEEGDDTYRLHGGPAHPFGEPGAGEGADATPGQHGDDVYRGSDAHGRGQYTRRAGGGA